MNSLWILGLQCFLAAMVCAAPIPLDNEADFELAVKIATGLVKKILHDVPGVHKNTVYTNNLSLDGPTGNLQLMVKTLGIPPAPAFKALSPQFTLEMCLHRMSLGLQLHQDLLGVLTQRLDSPTRMKDLLADITELLAQVHKMQVLAQLSVTPQSAGSGFASRLSEDYEVQVASHLTLQQLRTFSHDLVRSFRTIDAFQPGTLP